MPKYAAKVDTHHRQIVDELRQLGWSVVDTSAAGGSGAPGFPDLLVGIGPLLPFAPAQKARGLLTSGLCLAVEVKGPAGKLTPDQQEWAWNWRGPLVIAETAEDVIEAVAQLRRAHGRG